jgi:hypothetical protein
MPPKSGVIDYARNPFYCDDWISQERRLTAHRQKQFSNILGKTIEEIKKINRNEGSYPAFVAIRWGFAEVRKNKLIPTEKWSNRFDYDFFGAPLVLSRNKKSYVKFPKRSNKPTPSMLECKPLKSRVGMYDYQKYFAVWKNWDSFEPRIDGINGVYAFRLKTEFGRLRGKSNVLYIGQCNQNANNNSRPGIWHRLQNYRQNNDGASHRLKEVEKAFGGRSIIEYSYVICDNPRSVEEALLADYYVKHLEFPPLNRSK